MLSDSQRRQIKRLRSLCFTWEEIEAKTGIPKTTLYYAVRRRRSKAREDRAIQRMEEIRRLRAKIQWLEAKLQERR